MESFQLIKRGTKKQTNKLSDNISPTKKKVEDYSKIILSYEIMHAVASLHLNSASSSISHSLANA